jgi:DNA (cytosine-5)-methyltransferase 1
MEQLSIFDFITEDKPLPTDIKLLSLFSGIGAFEKALDRLGINYELVNYCEIDKHASRSYSAIHNVSEELNLWDVTKVDEKALPKDIDLLTYGSPCQDISLVGKQKGLFNEDGSKTRSGLFFDALRIIEETQPRVAIAENVKNLVGKKFKEQFQIVLASLESAGYNNYWQVLNAKDYGIPQNRERVFIISIRKDIDNGMFEFPKGFPLEKRLKDVLEDSVDEKYYLSKFPVSFDIKRIKEKPTVNVVGRINSAQDGVVVSSDGIAPTHTAGHGNAPKIVEEQPITDESVKPSVAVNFEREKQQIVNSDKEIYQCECDSAWQDNKVGLKVSPTLRANNNNTFAYTGLRIRKLTPLETWRLMGFDDSDFHKAELVNSNTQLYKQAGNSIVVDVLEYILKQIFKAI